jgi:RNA 2',3'-cyclic 3'-phosphodiesterase
MTRAFVAVPLPETVLDAIADRLAGVSMVGRVATREQWHLTLQFLGDDADVDAVVAALEQLDVQGGRARVGGAGAFPDAGRARVLWLGLAEGTDVVARLANATARRLAPLGYEPDARPYRPHVTLARAPVPTDVRGLIGALGAHPVGPAWDVASITVYESRRHPTGADYVARATIALPNRALPS